MGLGDRQYWGEQGSQDQAGLVGGLTIGMPRPAKAVKYLLLINLGMFVLQIIASLAANISLSGVFGVTVSSFWQVWRFVTFQFLHDPTGIWHVALNMLALYMMGTPLEQRWGSRRFVVFYLTCGAVAGLAYVIAGALLGDSPWRPLMGASGGVFGILLAAAVLMPHMRIIFLFFPVPIRLAAAVIFGGMLLYLLTSLRGGVYSPEFWSQVAHFGGAVTAAVWMWTGHAKANRPRSARETNRGRWEQMLQDRRRRELEVDRILQKIHDQGLDSLTRQEKRTLHESSRQQRREGL